MKKENLVLNTEKMTDVLSKPIKLDKEKSKELTGYPHIDKPWQRLYTEEAINAEVPKMTIYESFSKVAGTRPNSPAIDYLGKKITFGKLKEQIDIAASAFINKGVKKGDMVTLITANTPENVIALYALNKIGAVANMVDLTLKEDALLNKLQEANSSIVIATDIFLENLHHVLDKTNVKEVIVTSPGDSLPFGIKQLYKLKNKTKLFDDRYKLWKDFIKVGKQNFIDRKESYEANRDTCILYTSGTTGKAKGVILTNENLNAMAVQYKNCGLEFDEGDRFFNEEPPFLSFCIVLGINLPLSLGMCIAMHPDYQPQNFADRIYKAKTEHVLGCPADWVNFNNNSEAQKRDYSFIKTAASGGVAFKVSKKEELNNVLSLLGCENKIVEGYGMTEGSSAMCTNVPQYNVLGTVGLPLPLMNVCIYDDENETELKCNEVGEICFNGPTVMKGYLNNESTTKETLKIHDDGKLWLHTGDLGQVLDDGGVQVIGRKKRLIIRHDGFKISPYEIENVINKNEYVDDCCVVAAPDNEHGYGYFPVAYVVLKENNNEEEIIEDICTICNLNITSRNLPRKFVLINELPLTKVGKVNHRLLEQNEETEKESGKTYQFKLRRK